MFKKKAIWALLGTFGAGAAVVSAVSVSACSTNSTYSDGWTVPTVNHLKEKSLKYYSLFFDPKNESVDPGSAQSSFAAIHDGDTFSLATERTQDFASVSRLLAEKLDIEEFTVSASTRLFGVDTPEVSFSDTTGYHPTTGLEKLWADRATNFVKEQLGFATYDYKPLITINGHDGYSRNVANVKYVPKKISEPIDGGEPDKQISWNDLGADLVRCGLARVAYTDAKYTSPNNAAEMPGVNALNTDYIDYLIGLQAKAIAEKVGIWSADRSNWWHNGQPGRNPNNAIFPKAVGISTDNGLK